MDNVYYYFLLWIILSITMVKIIEFLFMYFWSHTFLIYLWFVASNLIFVESPAGVGWSYSNTTSDYNTGDLSTGNKIGVFSLFCHFQLLCWCSLRLRTFTFTLSPAFRFHMYSSKAEEVENCLYKDKFTYRIIAAVLESVYLNFTSVIYIRCIT